MGGDPGKRGAPAGEHRWRARPHLARALRWALLAVPLVASSAAVYLLARSLPPTATRTWWGLGALLAAGLLTGMAVERIARRLLPIALLLRLALVFPDRVPSRLRLARTAAARRPRDELLWTGRELAPTSTADVVVALVTALGTHDRRTRGHCERVRVLCDMVAEELGLAADARDRLRWAALLHDVGKVEVSPRILNKPTGLSGTETAEVRQHPEIGAALTAPLQPWLGRWGDGILDHHERYDGAGYPHGKAGSAISQAGRLIAVVDAFETMTAARPYKRALATREAREELARCAGTHFDPTYVRAFLAISVPRLLWAMGPLAFLLQLPFLQPLAQSGARAGSAAPQAAGTLAAGAAVGAAALAGAVAAPAPDDASGVGAVRGGQQQAAQQQAPSPQQQPPRAAQPAPGAPATAAPLAAASAGALAAPAPSAGAAADLAPDDGAAAPAADAQTEPVATPAPAPAPEPGRTAAAEPAPTSPPPAAEQRPDEEHPAIVSGPPRTTSARTASFTLREVPDVQWECQLRGAADGDPSRWRPCSGTFDVTVERDGEQVLRVRDAATRDVVDAWRWTVTG